MELKAVEFETFGHKGVFFGEMVASLVKPGEDIIATLTPEKMDLLHMAVGMAGEVGELVDAIKKYVVYNKPIDFENVVEESGDVEFYHERIRQLVRFSREAALTSCIEKLKTGEKARYKAGYSDKAAQERADKQ